MHGGIPQFGVVGSEQSKGSIDIPPNLTHLLHVLSKLRDDHHGDVLVAPDLHGEQLVHIALDLRQHHPHPHHFDYPVQQFKVAIDDLGLGLGGRVGVEAFVRDHPTGGQVGGQGQHTHDDHVDD